MLRSEKETLKFKLKNEQENDELEQPHPNSRCLTNTTPEESHLKSPPQTSSWLQSLASPIIQVSNAINSALFATIAMTLPRSVYGYRSCFQTSRHGFYSPNQLNCGLNLQAEQDTLLQLLEKQCGAYSSRYTCPQRDGGEYFGNGLFTGYHCTWSYEVYDNCVFDTLKNNTPNGYGSTEDLCITIAISGAALIAAVGSGICLFKKYKACAAKPKNEQFLLEALADSENEDVISDDANDANALEITTEDSVLTEASTENQTTKIAQTEPEAQPINMAEFSIRYSRI
jgi:hypothetical protein